MALYLGSEKKSKANVIMLDGYSKGYNVGYNDAMNGLDALKSSVSGEVISVNDVLDCPHELNINLSSDTVTDFSNTTVYRYGKNLLDISTLKSTTGIQNLTIDVENNTFSFETAIANYSVGVTMYAYLPIGTYRTSGNVTTTSGRNCGVLVRDEAGNFVVNNAGTSPNTTFTVTTPQIYSFSYYRPYSDAVGDRVTYSNVQLEAGSTTTEYEKYKEPQTATAAANGTVKGITSIAPNMTLYTDNSGAIINLKYFKDANLALENQALEIAMSGGE